MRSIEKYEQTYLQDPEDFETWQVYYRRKKVLEIYESLMNGKTMRVVEIGCGIEPLFSYVPQESFERWVVVEPADAFYAEACRKVAGDARIRCLHLPFGKENDSIKQCFAHLGGHATLWRAQACCMNWKTRKRFCQRPVKFASHRHI